MVEQYLAPFLLTKVPVTEMAADRVWSGKAESESARPYAVVGGPDDFDDGNVANGTLTHKITDVRVRCYADLISTAVMLAHRVKTALTENLQFQIVVVGLGTVHVQSVRLVSWHYQDAARLPVEATEPLFECCEASYRIGWWQVTSA